MKYAQSLQLQEANNYLKSQQAQVASGMSKEKVLQALRDNARTAEDKGKQLVQAYLRQELDDKTMLREFINIRKAYHTTEILKVKIAQS